MRDRSQLSTAPADFRAENLQAVRGSSSKADSFHVTVAMVEERSVRDGGSGGAEDNC